ncbi:MAG: hypothetical protein AAF517_02655 [Planctomycetota bacterium]
MARATAILDAGFHGLTLEEPLHLASWQELLAILPPRVVDAVSLLVPYSKRVPLKERAGLQLGLLDSSGRDELRRQADASIEAADRAQIPRIVVPYVDFSEARAEEERRRVLDDYLRTLDDLLSKVDRYSLRVALTPSDLRGEGPGPIELAIVEEEFRGASLSLWLDSVRVVPDATPSPSPEAEEETVDDVPPVVVPETCLEVDGMSIRDRDGERHGTVPGTGDVDWDAIDDRVQGAPIWALDLLETAPLEVFGPAFEHLQALEEGGEEDGGFSLF